MIEQFTITRRPNWSHLGDLTVTIECGPSASVKLGFAVRAALKSGAHLTRANLSGAHLTRANLSGAHLTRADLTRADLSGADLSGADLSGADLSGVLVRGEPVERLITRLDRQIDPYAFLAFRLQDQSVKVLAGCRWFTIAEFRDHVLKAYPDTPKATETLDILDFIELRANRETAQ